MKWWPVYVIVCALQDRQTVIPLQVAEDAWGVEEQDVLCLKLQEQFKFLTALLISFCGSQGWEELLRSMQVELSHSEWFKRKPNKKTQTKPKVFCFGMNNKDERKKKQQHDWNNKPKFLLLPQIWKMSDGQANARTHKVAHLSRNKAMIYGSYAQVHAIHQIWKQRLAWAIVWTAVRMN